MPLRIFIIILLLWTSVPTFAEAARLTLGVAPGAVRDAGLEPQARQLAAELTKSLGDEVSVRLFDNPLQVGQWLDPFAMIELGMVDGTFLAGHPGKFLVLGSTDQSGRWFLITRQGITGDLPQRVATALSHNVNTSSLIKSSAAPAPVPPPARPRTVPATSTPVRVAPPVAPVFPAAVSERPSPPAPAVVETPLAIGLMLTRDGLIRTHDQAKQFTVQLGRWLGAPVRTRLFDNEQTFVDWFSRFQVIDMALIDEPGRHDPLAGNYRPLQRLVAAGGSSGLLISRQDLPEGRLQGILQGLASFGHDPSLEEILTAATVKPSTIPTTRPSAVASVPVAPSPVVAASPAVVAISAPVLPEPPVLPRLPEAPMIPSAPAVPVTVQPVPAEPPAPVAVVEPAAPVVAIEPPAPVAVTEPPVPVAVVEPAAPAVPVEPPAPVAAATEQPVPVTKVEPAVPVAVSEPPTPVTVVEQATPAVPVEPPAPVAAASEPAAGVPPQQGASPPEFAGTGDVPAVIAQPDLPQELRPPGVPLPRPGREPEALPPAEEPTVFGKLQDLFGRTPKPQPLLPPADPEPGVVYVVPFITLMVPAEVRDRAFDQFVDILNQRGVERELRFVILKQGLDKVDREWLGERKYVLGEIYGYVEDSGCCSTDLRTRSRVTLYRAHLPDPTLKYEYPVRLFFDHDQSTLTTERQRLADQIARVLAEELLKALQL